MRLIPAHGVLRLKTDDNAHLKHAKQFLLAYLAKHSWRQCRSIWRLNEIDMGRVVSCFGSSATFARFGWGQEPSACAVALKLLALGAFLWIDLFLACTRALSRTREAAKAPRGHHQSGSEELQRRQNQKVPNSYVRLSFGTCCERRHT